MKEAELKKHEIDYWSMPRLTAVSVLSGQSNFHWMDEKNHFLIKKTGQRQKTKDWDLEGRTQVNNFEQNEFKNRDGFKLSDYKHFWRFQFRNFNAEPGLIVFNPIFFQEWRFFERKIWWKKSNRLLWRYMSLNGETFQYWEHFWHSRTIRIAIRGTSAKMIKPSSLPTSKSLRSCSWESRQWLWRTNSWNW